MATVNELLRDLNIGHQVDLTQYANDQVRKVISLLNQSDSELFAQLTQALERMPAESFTVQRLEQQLLAVREMNAALYRRMLSGFSVDLKDLAQHELGFQGQMLLTVPPVSVPLVALAPETVYAAVLARPFQGRLLSEWTLGLGADRMARIRDTIRIGFVNSEPIAQMVGRLRGTRAKGYADGLLDISRRNAETVVRTAVSHTANVARDSLYQANSDLIKAIQWVSTLDARTSGICRARDGKQYTCDAHSPIGHSLSWLGGPGQAHWNCRSSSTPVLKSWKELGLDMNEMPEGTRASMDGQVAANLRYGDWFGKQSAARQDQIVGVTRGRMFRAGEMSFDQFSNNKGRLLTLKELAHEPA